MRIKGSPGGESASGNVPDPSQIDQLVQQISKTIADLVIAPMNKLTKELKRERAKSKKELAMEREGLKTKLREEGEGLKMVLEKELAKIIGAGSNQVKELRKAEEDSNNAKKQVRELLQTLCERELAKSIFTVCGCASQGDRVKFLKTLRKAGKAKLINLFGKMTKEDFDDLLVVLDTDNHGVMQKGNQLAHEFTIEQGEKYTKHSAFLLFLKFLRKEEGGGAMINDASERKKGELQKLQRKRR